MSAPNITVDVEFDFLEEEDVYEDMMITFLIKCGPLNIKVSYTDMSVMPIEDLLSFIDDLSKPEIEKAHVLSFCECNGEVDITLKKDGFVAFGVSKAGSGGDGSIIIDIPRNACLDAFKKVAEKCKSFTSPNIVNDIFHYTRDSN
jgi:hypothetical protein